MLHENVADWPGVALFRRDSVQLIIGASVNAENRICTDASKVSRDYYDTKSATTSLNDDLCYT